jgi:hypothetical protein
MRWRIVRTLVHKEIQRQLANRGGIALALLLVGAAALLAIFAQGDGQAGPLAGGVTHCFIDYSRDDGWVRHMKEHLPAGMRRQVKFRHLDEATRHGDQIVYPPGTGAIQMRAAGTDGTAQPYRVWIWHPGHDTSGMAIYEAWFWRESARYFQHQAALALEQNGAAATSSAPLPDFVQETSQLKGGVDMRSSITTALVLFALFFSCVYLLPSLMCEERERGILLAQALSPASPNEILAAKFLFYPIVGMLLAAVIAGICKPLVLTQPFFWLALAAAAFGSLGIGLTIACLARTQRTASMGALCYMLVVAMLLFICQQANIPGLPLVALEYHCPRMLHAVLEDSLVWYHWANLAAAGVLAAGWASLAHYLFRRCGWQS